MKNIAGEMFVPLDSEIFIKQRHIRNCFRADPAYGKGVAEALGLSLEEANNADDPAHPDWDDRAIK